MVCVGSNLARTGLILVIIRVVLRLAEMARDYCKLLPVGPVSVVRLLVLIGEVSGLLAV